MHSSKPVVSVIVPMYNTEKYIAETINSVQNQTYKSWEMLLIDDGSTDRTQQIVESFLHDTRIKYHYKPNGGQGSARNMGINLAKGIYLAFIDADDLWDPDKLKKQLDVFTKYDISLTFSKLRCIQHTGRFLNTHLGSGKGEYEGLSSLFLLSAGSITIPNSSVMVKKEHVLKVGRFSEAKSNRDIEDYELWYRLLLSGYRFYGINKVLGSYRRHKDQVTHHDAGLNLKMITYLENFCHIHPEKKTFLRFSILQRMSAYCERSTDKKMAQFICMQRYYATPCIQSYWFDKYLISFFGFNNYLRFRRLMIRRFKRYKYFIQSIDEQVKI